MSESVRIILPGVLRELADGLNELVVPLGDGSTSLRTVLDAAVLDRPQLAARIRDETGALRRHVNVFVNGQDTRRLGGLDAPVGSDAVVHILPSVAGG
ncbi:MAG: sulfur-carrier protein [Actinomycetota bacterium]|jgi:molybdopterin synthase sulfur carrier subunit|nr:sulfur-carrier protein [Actinomycetota bacterium]